MGKSLRFLKILGDQYKIFLLFVIFDSMLFAVVVVQFRVKKLAEKAKVFVRLFLEPSSGTPWQRRLNHRDREKLWTYCF